MDLTPPKNHLSAGLSAIGIVAAFGTVGGSVGSLAARGDGDSDLTAIASCAVAGVLTAGLGGAIAAGVSPSWRLTGLYAAGIGIGLPLAAIVYAQFRPPGKPRTPVLPPGPPAVGQDGVAAALTLSPGAQSVSVPTGSRLVLQAPAGGILSSVQAPGLAPSVLTAPWVVLTVPSAGQVVLVWRDASGAGQTTAVQVQTS